MDNFNLYFKTKLGMYTEAELGTNPMGTPTINNTSTSKTTQPITPNSQNNTPQTNNTKPNNTVDKNKMMQDIQNVIKNYGIDQEFADKFIGAYQEFVKKNQKPNSNTPPNNPLKV